MEIQKDAGNVIHRDYDEKKLGVHFDNDDWNDDDDDDDDDDAMAACGIHPASASGDHASTYLCNISPCSRLCCPV